MIPFIRQNAGLAWCLAWAAFAAVWCATAGHAIGPTYDEPFYVQAGMNNWRSWNHRELLTQGVMPLGTEIQTLPLRGAELLTSVDPAEDWLGWLPTARLGTIAFFWLLLWAAYRLGFLYGGTIAGCWVVALTACEPILLGHASLATTDLPFTACLLALAAVFCARRDEATWPRRLLLPSFWVTLAFLAKASALLFVPAVLGTMEMHRLLSAGWRPGRTLDSWKPALSSLRDLAVIAVLGVAMLFIVCPRASRGLFYMVRYAAMGGSTTFLLESTSNTGFRHYFAAALAIKLGLPTLILLAFTFLLRPKAWFNAPMLAALALLALTPTFRLQLGVRHVLPIAALAIVGASVVLGQWWSEQQTRGRRIAVGALASVLGLWSLANGVLVWPNGTCYTNELFGGTERGFLALSDSNYDWGQGVPELADWQARHADVPLHVWYFGTDPRAKETPFHAIEPSVSWQGPELRNACGDGYLAVSTTWLYGHYFDTPIGQYLRRLRPCDRTTTFLIYDFRTQTNGGVARQHDYSPVHSPSK